MSNIAVVNFNSGKISQQADARKDIDKYTGGCRRCDNMIPDVFGNATKRPGTELVVAGNGAGCYYEAVVPDPAKIGITTIDELQKIGNDVAYPRTGDYELLSNIDAAGFDWQPLGADAGGLTVFTGTLDGNYFTISNLTVSGPDVAAGIGLFGKATSAQISNLIVELTIENFPEAQGNLFSNFGSIVGTFSGDSSSLINCRGTLTFDSARYRYATVGGLVGRVSDGIDLTRCSADINIIARDDGGAGSDITRLGGLVGSMGSVPPAAVLTDCYATGNITDLTSQGMEDVGGLIGEGVVGAVITNCYSAVEITGAIEHANTVGGFIGTTIGAAQTYSDCFWDNDLIPILSLDDTGDDGDVANVTKSTTSTMKTQSTYTGAGWDFGTIWKLPAGGGYPVHQWTEKSDIKANCQAI